MGFLSDFYKNNGVYNSLNTEVLTRSSVCLVVSGWDIDVGQIIKHLHDKLCSIVFAHLNQDKQIPGM